jgi:prophage regulatory protein
MSTTNFATERGEASQRILSIKDVEHLTSLKKSTIYALVQSGSFPAQIPITVRRKGWLITEVVAWIERRAGRSLVGAN